MDYLIRYETPHSFTVLKWIDEAPSDEYHLFRSRKGWTCSCPDSIYRGGKCKHQRMVTECVAKGIPQPFMMET